MLHSIGDMRLSKHHVLLNATCLRCFCCRHLHCCHAVLLLWLLCCRPVGEFLEHKRNVAKRFAETAANTGWAINTHTVPSSGWDWSTAFGEVWVLSLTADHQVALAAIIWRTASWLASMDSSVKGEQLKARQGTVELLLSLGDHQCAMLQLQNDTGKPQWLSSPLIALLWKAQ